MKVIDITKAKNIVGKMLTKSMEDDVAFGDVVLAFIIYLMQDREARGICRYYWPEYLVARLRRRQPMCDLYTTKYPQGIRKATCRGKYKRCRLFFKTHPEEKI